MVDLQGVRFGSHLTLTDRISQNIIKLTVY